jgi:hypothetical protein
MPWTWRYEKADGTVVPADDLQEAIFISQGDAESWLGENWRALLAVGVDQVTLFDDARVEYGPMSLHPEDLQVNSPRYCNRAGGTHRQRSDIGAGLDGTSCKSASAIEPGDPGPSPSSARSSWPPPRR